MHVFGAYITVGVLLAVIFCGCDCDSGHQASSTPTNARITNHAEAEKVASTLAYLDEIATRIFAKEDISVEQVYGLVEQDISKFESPSALLEVYQKANSRLTVFNARCGQDMLQAPRPYGDAMDAVVCRLGDLSSRASADALVDIVFDGVDGALSVLVGHNISRIGPNALPALGRLRDTDHELWRRELVKHIMTGRVYGP